VNLLSRLFALAALCAAAVSASAQVAPSLSLAEQMRGMLGKPPTAAAPTVAPTFSPAPAVTSASALTALNAPIVVNGPSQVRQSATELAQRFPAQHRAAMTKAYEESFAFWQKLETQLGLTPNDVGAGVAAFIAGNYSAFMQQQVPDENFKSLVLQMQRLLAQNAAFTQSSAAAKRSMFEQLAMVGTFMAVYREHLNQKPDANQEVNFRNAAKANLEAALGLSVERLQIGPQGLVAR
jgi:maltooligosyltrehalose synthase